jgi:hypothetical protein
MEDRSMTSHYDDPISINSDAPLRLSADALRCLKKATGRTMSELLTDDDDDVGRFQVLAFAELYRRLARLGHLPDAGELWERAGAVELDFVSERRDPTPGESSTGSPPSVATGT